MMPARIAATTQTKNAARFETNWPGLIRGSDELILAGRDNRLARLTTSRLILPDRST
jgi:hypothetical protein